MLESAIEKYLCKRIEDIGGIAYKFVSPSRRSVPDRICVLPKGKHIFVECKAEGGRLRLGQEREIERLRELCQPVAVVASKAEVDELISVLKVLINGN